jgi:hypothetical protein
MLGGMKTLIQTLLHRIVSVWRERWYLQLEYLTLRHQLEVSVRSPLRVQELSRHPVFNVRSDASREVGMADVRSNSLMMASGARHPPL